METRFRSSFIPKNAAGASGLQKKEPLGFFGALASVVLVLCLLSVGGLFAYKKILDNSISGLRAELSAAEAAVDKAEIDKLAAFDKKLNAAEEILRNHVEVTDFLDMLEKNSVSQIVFNDLKYSAPSGKDIMVEMNGSAPSYAAIAEQERVFLRNQYVISAEFGNLSVDPKKGGAMFNFKGTFKKDLVNFFEVEEKVETAPAEEVSEGDIPTGEDLSDLGSDIESIETDISNIQ